MIRRSQKNLSSISNFAAVRHHPMTLIHSTDPHFSTAKEDRQLHTLKPITAAATPPPTFNATGAPASKPLSAARTSGPIRTQHISTQARMQTGPMSSALKARVMGNTSKTSKADKAPANPETTSPIETEPSDQVERVRYAE